MTKKMGELTAAEAKVQVDNYVREIDKAIRGMEKNFEEMDFENANRRDEIEDLVEEMVSECQAVRDGIEALSFEE